MVLCPSFNTLLKEYPLLNILLAHKLLRVAETVSVGMSPTVDAPAPPPPHLFLLTTSQPASSSARWNSMLILLLTICVQGFNKFGQCDYFIYYDPVSTKDNCVMAYGGMTFEVSLLTFAQSFFVFRSSSTVVDRKEDPCSILATIVSPTLRWYLILWHRDHTSYYTQNVLHNVK